MIPCCKALGECTSKCCRCLCKDCDCCSKPFMPCAILNFFIMLIPGLIIFIVSLAYLDNDCDSPLEIFGVIQGLLFCANFGMAVYMVYKLGKSDNSIQEDKDICTRTFKLICYDVLICIYVFVLLFELIWLILGSVWIQDHGCSDDPLVNVCYMGIALMWIFLIVGLLLFLCNLTVIACQEGSCGSQSCFKDMLYCFFCCCLCENQRNKKQEIRTQRVQQPEQKNFVMKSMDVFFSAIGLRQKNNQEVQQRNPQQYQPQPPQQYQPQPPQQYQPQPPQQYQPQPPQHYQPQPPQYYQPQPPQHYQPQPPQPPQHYQPQPQNYQPQPPQQYQPQPSAPNQNPVQAYGENQPQGNYSPDGHYQPQAFSNQQ